MSIETAFLAIVTSVAAGLMGSFAVMRRTSLAADPLSHVALPGIASQLQLETRPVVVLVAAAVFLLTLCLPRGSTAASSDVESS